MYQVLSQREFGSGNCRQLIWPEHSQEGVNLEQGARRAEPGGFPKPSVEGPLTRKLLNSLTYGVRDLSELPCSLLSRASPLEEKEHGLGIKEDLQSDSSTTLSG